METTPSAQRNSLLALASISCLLLGCSPNTPAPDTPPLSPAHFDTGTLSGENALAYVDRLLSISPRDAGTPGASNAAEVIFATLADLGLSPEIDQFTDSTPAGPKQFHNVICETQPLATQTIVLGSHFDTKSGITNTFQGANDSGSSTGLLLELARLLAETPPPPHINIIFAFFDGEEAMVRYSHSDGLHGSRHYAKTLSAQTNKSILAVIILDMIGDKNLNITIPKNSSRPLPAYAFEAATEHGVRSIIGSARTSILDDHVPFLDAGFPAIDLIDFSYGETGEDNSYWHTAADTRDKLSAESLEITGKITVGMLNRLIRAATQ